MMSDTQDRLQTISAHESRHHARAVQNARNSVRLEGFVLGETMEPLNDRHVAGKLTDGQYMQAVLGTRPTTQR